jgi:hypothetical protein
MNRLLSKKFIYLLCFALVLFGSARLYYRMTDDFRTGNIEYELPFESQWQLPELKQDEQRQLAAILDQKFSYLGKGAQCYAFVSDDGLYVLKFFKFKHLKPHFLVDLLPSIPPLKGFKESTAERKQRKLMSVYDGYDLAYRENREDSQLLYLHLIPSENLHKKVTVIDKIGFKKSINLDDVVFLVQRKGETLRTRLQTLLNQDNVREAEKSISSILEMYIAEYRKGIYDRDHGVMHNTGFVGDRPFHLDVGKLSKEEQMRQVDVHSKDLEHVLWKIDVWVKANYPQHYQNVSPFLAREYHRLTGGTYDIASVDPARFKKRRH